MALTFGPDGGVLDLSPYPGAYYSAGDGGGGSEGAAPSPAGYYLPGYYDSSGAEGFSVPAQYLGAAVYRPARYTDFDFSQIGDPNSAIRKYLRVDPYWYGREVVLWNSLRHVVEGPEDRLMQAQSLSGLIPADQVQAVLGGTAYAFMVPLLQQVNTANAAFNDATADYEKRILGFPQRFVLLAATVFAGGMLGAGLAAAGEGVAAAGAGEVAGASAADAIGFAGDLADFSDVAVSIGASESFVGPATGAVLEAGAQASGALVTPVGVAGAPIVSGVAVGAGAFGGADLIEKGLSALKSAGASAVQKLLGAGALQKLLGSGGAKALSPATGAAVTEGGDAPAGTVTPAELGIGLLVAWVLLRG